MTFQTSYLYIILRNLSSSDHTHLKRPYQFAATINDHRNAKISTLHFNVFLQYS